MASAASNITACILARNEEHRIEAALRSLQGWTAQIIVIDNESEDRTVEIARCYTDCILSAPKAANFDAARNLAIEAATGDWIFYLDADERVPPRLGPELQQLVLREGEQFEALILPFKHYFCGQWMQHSGWWPGYTRPQLLKKGRFHYNERLHSGAQVDGRTAVFPADDPEFAIVHYSYEDLHHYLAKLNRYTDGEAESLLADGQSHSWQAMLAHFVHDWQVYYDRNHADRDGMHGFVLSFMSAFYRFASRAKLWDLRRQQSGQSADGLNDGSGGREANDVPRSLREALEFMAQVAQQGAEPWLSGLHTADTQSTPATSAASPPSVLSVSPCLRGEESGPEISAVILARNEEARLPDALRSLEGWVSQILVLDHGSTDGTAELARSHGATVIPVPFEAQATAAGTPRGQNFDGLRNLALPHVTGDWVLVIDADERIPPRLAEEYVRLARDHADEFEGVIPPFRNHFCGKWIRHAGWYPGYIHLQLLKVGKFRFSERLHGGIEVEGRQLHLPAEDPELAVLHHTYDHLHKYLEKLNRYTDAEAEALRAEGASHSWQAMLAHFTHEWHLYYEEGRGHLDGMHGFVLSFMSAFYRFTSRAKLWDLRRKQGELSESEPVPTNLGEMFQFMAHVLQHGPGDWLTAASATGSTSNAATLPHSDPPNRRFPLLWRAPLLDPSGYADEARQFVAGLIEAGESLAVHCEPWGGSAELGEELRAAIASRTVPADSLCELQVFHTLPGLQQPAPTARFNVARTMFETDRLPSLFVERLNRMDRVWAPSEFNRETFVRSGVDPDKVAVIPGGIDPSPYLTPVQPWPLPAFPATPTDPTGKPPYVFLSVFDWTLHKGWDVLLEAFAREFGGDPQVRLLVKTWSTNHYHLDELHRQADTLLRQRLGRGLAEFPNVQLWWENLPAAELPRLYRAADAFVLPTRGEGWCRPLMEAMACGLPTIATAWSGLTAFHSAEVGYPLPYQLRPVSEAGAREIPIYSGHCWAEPNREALQGLMRQLVGHPDEGRKKGQAARLHVLTNYSRAAVTSQLLTELSHCRALAAAKTEGTRSGVTRWQGSSHPVDQPAPEFSVSSHLRAEAVLRKPKAHPVPFDPTPTVDFRERLGRPLRVRWEGDFRLLSSLALVNREYCLGLVAPGDVELSLSEHSSPWHSLTEQHDPRLGALFARLGAPLSGPPDVVIRHHFPPSWGRPADLAPEGKLIVIQPWEYGHVPVEWVQGALHGADETWAYTRWVRDAYVRSGAPAERLRVLPLGFNPDVFTPEGAAYPLDRRRTRAPEVAAASAEAPEPALPRTRFLFVGGALDRKGADLLLQAYARAFRPEEPVLLVVKDMGTRTFYQQQTFGAAFQRAAADPAVPEILYLDDDLSDAELASLYRSCTCVVLPYRGEGFALSPLEGMACGLPVIVTAGGPTDDYLDDELALRVPHRRQSRPGEQVGPFRCTGAPWQLEPDLDALVAALRWVHEHPDEARERGAAAREHVAAAWTWPQAAACLRARLAALVAPATATVAEPLRAWSVEAATGAPARKRSGTKSGAAAGRFRPVRNAAASSETPDEITVIGRQPAAIPATRSPFAAPSGGGNGKAPSISLCMIARDEEPRLGECLRSIAPFVDELILVDTGSTDRTREIAAECGARVYELPWPDSFAAARNASLDQATGDWIFWMDADDVISPECGRGLRALAVRHPNRDAAYHVAVQIPPGPGEFSPSLVDHVKLFPNRPDLRFEHRIHEQILPALRKAQLDVRFSDLYVTHQNYDRSDAGQEKKRRRDYRLLELDLRDRPDHPFVLFNLGMTYLYATHEYEVAAHYLRRSLDQSHPADSIVRKAYAMLGTARICLQEWESAIRSNEEGRRHYPHDAELLFQAGQVYQQVGNFEDARRCLERLTEGADDEHYRSVDVGLRTYRGQHELALLFRRMGDAPHCEQVLRAIAAAQPGYLTAQVDLVETVLLQGQHAEARSLLAGIPVVKGVELDIERLSQALA